MIEKKSNKLTVRPAQAEELAAVAQILSEARAVMEERGILQWTREYPSSADLRADLERGRLYVAVKDGCPIAAAQILCEGDPSYREIDGAWRGQGAHIAMHRVTVSSQMPRCGAATALILYAEECGRAHGATSLRMDTHPDNLPMQALLEKCGFFPCGRVKEPVTGKWHLAYEKPLTE